VHCVRRNNGSVIVSVEPSDRSDDRLPLRWGLIVICAVAAGITMGTAWGSPAGVGTGLAVAGLLGRILGN
jgi:hypothetical protein